MRKLLFLLALAFPFAGFSQSLRLSPLFASDMVMQQQSAAPIWGTAGAGQDVSIAASWGEAVAAKADADGRWKAVLHTPKAGGPFSITIKCAADETVLSNVMSGEVWICSGQSNMEMPLAGWPPADTLRNAKQEIADASHPMLRFISVAREIGYEPKSDFSGEWKVCSPETAPAISATAYFFGRKLQQELKVPVGLIITCWGGTAAEAWTAPESLRAYDDFYKLSQSYAQVEQELQAYKRWLHKHPVVKNQNPEGDDYWVGLDFSDKQLSDPSFDDRNWDSMEVPGYFESKLGSLDGVVWFRTKINVPAGMAGKAGAIALSKIDDMDRVYVNGTLVGSTERGAAYQVYRRYAIPEGLIKEGENTIAVRVLDNTGNGGIWGDKEDLYLSSGSDSVALAGMWRYFPLAELEGADTFYLFDPTVAITDRPKCSIAPGPNLPGVLYNAMIAPLVPVAAKGFIWYQGEANVGRAQQYTTLFPDMINGWRKAWSNDKMPFYYVQIAPYAYSGETANESAYIREAQRRALTTPNTGMVVTMDIGTVRTIHPSNKVDVGNRLAAFALSNDYKRRAETYGPMFKDVIFQDGVAIVTFANDKGLKITGDSESEFEIAGENGRFVPAAAYIKGDKIIVKNNDVANPKYVRYGFKNGSTSVLTNKSGLPASTFTTETELK